MLQVQRLAYFDGALFYRQQRVAEEAEMDATRRRVYASDDGD